MGLRVSGSHAWSVLSIIRSIVFVPARYVRAICDHSMVCVLGIWPWFGMAFGGPFASYVAFSPCCLLFIRFHSLLQSKYRLIIPPRPHLYVYLLRVYAKVWDLGSARAREYALFRPLFAYSPGVATPQPLFRYFSWGSSWA